MLPCLCTRGCIARMTLQAAATRGAPRALSAPASLSFTSFVRCARQGRGANSAGAQAPLGVRGRRGVAPLPAVLPWLVVAEQPCKQNILLYKHVSVATCGMQRQPATGSVGLSCQRHAPS